MLAKQKKQRIREKEREREREQEEESSSRKQTRRQEMMVEAFVIPPTHLPTLIPPFRPLPSPPSFILARARGPPPLRCCGQARRRQLLLLPRSVGKIEATPNSQAAHLERH